MQQGTTLQAVMRLIPQWTHAVFSNIQVTHTKHIWFPVLIVWYMIHNISCRITCACSAILDLWKPFQIAHWKLRDNRLKDLKHYNQPRIVSTWTKLTQKVDCFTVFKSFPSTSCCWHKFSPKKIEKIGWLDVRGSIRDVYIEWVAGDGLAGKDYSSKLW